jgi:hypothetical protein
MNQLVVRKYNPRTRTLLMLASVVGIILIMYGLFEFGRYRAGYDLLLVNERIDELRQVNMQLQQELDALSLAKSLLETGKEIDDQASESVRTELKDLQRELLELKEELAFYRGIVSPKEASQGLYIQTFNITKNDEERSFRYKLVLTQVLKNDRHVRGKIDVMIEGIMEEDGRQEQIRLRDVTVSKNRDLEYRFKYFQSFEGDMKLPDGFVPIRVIVTVTPRYRSQKQIEKVFNWEIGGLREMGNI